MSLSQGKRRLILIALGLVLFSGVALIVWSFMIEPGRLVVKEAHIRIPQWPLAFDRLRIVLISDLHVGSPHNDIERLRQIVETINGQQPDLVLIAGDFVIQDVVGGEFVEPELIASELRRLRTREGVYAVLGNHDWWYDGDRIIRAMNSEGVRVLENDVARIEREGQYIWIAGLADLWTAKPDITGTLGKIQDPATIIALTHNPDIFPAMPRGVALTLAGHTHGGQVNLPFIGRRVVPSKFRERYAIGLVEEDGHQLFVTPGIGTSILPLRFRVPPEISVITIAAG